LVGEGSVITALWPCSAVIRLMWVVIPLSLDPPPMKRILRITGDSQSEMRAGRGARWSAVSANSRFWGSTSCTT
jgi:hypothetical protein